MKISVLGTGGHGWRSIAGLIDTYSSSEFLFWYLTVDWGGFTGLWGRMIEDEEGGYNDSLHGEGYLPFRPFGDICKVIDYYLKIRFGYQEIHDIFLARNLTNHVLEHRIERLLTLLNLPHLKKELTHYCQKSIELLHQFTQNTSVDIGVEKAYFGYLFTYFLYHKAGGCMVQFNVILHSFKLIPPNLKLFFTNSFRKQLSYKHDSYTLEGEDIIDGYTEELNGDSLELTDIHIYNIRTKNIRYIFSDTFDFGFEFLLNSMSISDYIIIPNGSIANWLPLLKNPALCTILQEKSKNSALFMMMNIFRSQNEQDFFVYIQYLRSLLISPIILGSQIELMMISIDLLEQYEDQGKKLNKIHNLKADHFVATLQIVERETKPLYEGIKYDLESVVRAFKLFWG